MEMIEFRELVELFLNTSIHEIKTEYETPNINFKFGDDGFALFKNIVEKPFVKKGYWTPNAKQEDIEFVLSHNDDDVPTIYIGDSVKFFTYLTDITNSLIKLSEEYGEKKSARNLAMQILRRIWLRMGIEDITNVNDFLDRQLQFSRNRTLDIYNIEKIGLFNEHELFMKSFVNATYDETTRSMIFTIQGNNSVYELPHILYDIDDNNICYIYAVQSSKRANDKKIERELYRVNKNIKDPNVHPSKVYSLILFINELKKNGITKIRVPSIQILSYRYHELISNQAEKKLEQAIKKIEENPSDDYTQYNYNFIKQWYDRTYNKQDKISYLKTEDLINLVYRMLEHDPNIQIVNDVNIQGDYLDVRIK